MRTRLNAIAAAVIVGLGVTACGGGSSGTDANTGTSTTQPSEVYPIGLAIASPGSVLASNAAVTASLEGASPQARLADWFHTLSDGVMQGDSRKLALALNSLLPVSSARAAPMRFAEARLVADLIEAISSGTETITTTTLPFNELFGAYQAASCYGPSVPYDTHQDAGGGSASGTLPGGDVGMWKATEADGTPCAVSELNALVDPVKTRANASLMLGAKLVQLALADGGMPAAGTSKSLSTEFEAFLSGLLPSGTTIDEMLAAITNNGSNSYTYQMRTKLNTGAVLAIKITHTRSGSSGFNGIIQYAASDMLSAASADCGSGMKTVNVGSLRYSDSGTALDFSAREAPYCASTTDDVTTDFGSFVSLDGNDELDPAANTRAVVTGWDQQGSGFKRFAARIDPDTFAGSYLFAWQAGTGDSHSRMFAAQASYNSITEDRALDAYYGYAADMGTATHAGNMLGLICNWAGPGNSHVPQSYFQSQSASLTASATAWSLNASKITYAPANSCSSTTTSYDQDGDGALSAGEGVGVSADLDAPSGSNTVAQELTSRGFSIPGYY